MRPIASVVGLLSLAACAAAPGAAPGVSDRSVEKVTGADDTLEVVIDGPEELDCGDDGTVTVEVTGSKPMLDVVLALDSSGSLGTAGWASEVDAAQELIAAFDVSSTEDNVAVFQFATSITELHGFEDTQTETAIDSAITGARYTAGYTDTVSVIEAALKELERDGRTTPARTLILFTDGNPYVPSGGDTDVCALESDLKAEGIQVYLVLAGTNVTPDKLDCLVNDPDNDIFEIDDFDSASDIIDDLVDRFPQASSTTFTTTLGADVSLSGTPTATLGAVKISGDELVWDIGDLGAGTETMELAFNTDAEGLTDVLTDSVVDYYDRTDGDSSLDLDDLDVDALTCKSNLINGFEDATERSKGSLVTSPITQGSHALSVTASWWTPIKSDPFSGEDIAGSSTMAVDVFIPTSPPNPYWIGDLQASVNCPADGVYNAYLGRQAFTGKTLGQYHTLTFSVSSTVEAAMTSSDDCTVQLNLNAPAGGSPFLFDNLRFQP